MTTNEFTAKFNQLPTLSQQVMAKIILCLYAEPGFSDVMVQDLPCTPAQWTGVCKRLLDDGLIFIEHTTTNNEQRQFIYAPVHTYEAEDDGSWEQLKQNMKLVHDPRFALTAVCHTSERTPTGHLYTLDDIRYPELSGKQIRSTLVQGEYQFTWEA